MSKNLPPVRQIVGLSAESASDLHDVLSWLDAMPNSVELPDSAEESLYDQIAYLCDAEEEAMPTHAEMDDLGNAAIVWGDADGNSWLHVL